MAFVSFGAGFRTPHSDEIARAVHAPDYARDYALDWLEVQTENFIGIGGRRRALLDRLRADHPILLHGVALSIAGTDPIDEQYLRGLRELADRVEPAFVSDHLCWTALGGHQSHDLLPVAKSAAVLDHVAARVGRVQETLGRRLLLENATVYVAFRGDEMDEAEFFRELCRRSGCGMLLDVNNLYVNAQNLGIDPQGYLASLSRESVGYMHLAGHAVLPDVRIDTHDADVPEPVWQLFDAAVRRFPEAGVIVERDDKLPPFAELCAEVACARARHARARAAGVAQPDASPARAPKERVGTAPGWRATQAEFWNRFVEKPIGFDHARLPGLGGLVDESRPVSAARGLRVYSDAYAASLPRALAVNFPALARVLEPEDFRELCREYLRTHPPRGHDFRLLGAKLAEFARDFPLKGSYGVETRVLAELVALEQAQLEVQDEVDQAEPLESQTLAALAPVEWESARFELVRALRIVRATHDVLPVVEAVARGETPARPKAARTSYLVCRSAGRLETRRISEREADLAAELVAGRSFSEVCEAAQAREGADLAEVALDAVRLLVGASELGLILRCSA